MEPRQKNYRMQKTGMQELNMEPRQNNCKIQKRMTEGNHKMKET